jgi:hypothetical protein
MTIRRIFTGVLRWLKGGEIRRDAPTPHPAYPTASAPPLPDARNVDVWSDAPLSHDQLRAEATLELVKGLGGEPLVIAHWHRLQRLVASSPGLRRALVPLLKGRSAEDAGAAATLLAPFADCYEAVRDATLANPILGENLYVTLHLTRQAPGGMPSSTELRRQALSADDHLARLVSLENLACLPPENKDAAAALKEAVLSDAEPAVRARAARLLVGRPGASLVLREALKKCTEATDLVPLVLTSASMPQLALQSERQRARRRLKTALKWEMEQETNSYRVGQYAAALATYPNERPYFQGILGDSQLPWRLRAVALDVVGQSLPRDQALKLYRVFLFQPRSKLASTAAMLLLEQVRHEE